MQAAGGRVQTFGSGTASYDVPGRSGQARFYYPRVLVVLQPTLRTADGGRREVSAIQVVPLSCTVTLDAAERSNLADMELRVRDFPLDPRAVDDMRVVVFMADVEIPEVDLYLDNTDHAQFIGFVDYYEYAFDDRGPSVRLRCRDYSGRLMEQRYNGPPIRTDATLLDIVVGIVERAPGFERLNITIENDKVLRAFVRTDVWTPSRGASLWDVLVALGREAGQEVAFEGGNLTFRTARNIPNGRTFSLTLGATLRSLRIERAPAPLYRSAIALRQINARTGETVEGVYPSGVSSDRWFVYPVAGAYTKADLERMARHAFEAQATTAVQGTAETEHMADDAGEDLCGVSSIRAGDSLLVRIAGGGTAGALGQPAEQVVAYLEAAGVPSKDAADLVATWDRMNDFANLFVVRTARHTIDGRGYRLVLDFENVVRAA